MHSVFDLPLLIFVLTLPLLWLAVWAGTLFRARFRHSSEDMQEDYGIIIGATLTLLGLIIGFTFSMAITRYDLRKTLEEEEANAIGTEYLRADLLPDEDSVGLRALLRQYTDLRIQFYSARNDLNGVNSATESMQKKLWAIVARTAKTGPDSLAALAASGMNDVLNAQGYTQAAWWNRIPAPAWAMMYAIAVLSNFLLGYGSHGRAALLSTILPLVVAISFTLIADIDSPRGGIIRVSPQNLTALAASLKTQ